MGIVAWKCLAVVSLAYAALPSILPVGGPRLAGMLISFET